MNIGKLILSGVVVGFAVGAFGATTVIRVPSDQATIAAALTAAASATALNPVEIQVAAGDYTQTATLQIPAYVTVRGVDADPSLVKILASGSVSLVKLVTGATLSGVTVRGGYTKASSTGSNVTMAGGVLTNCRVRNAQGANGAVYNSNGLVTHCRIFENDRSNAANGIGLSQTGASAVTQYCEIFNNRRESIATTAYNGAGAYIYGGRLSYCIITNNMTGPVMGNSSSVGGVILRDSVIMDHCLVANNVARSIGGISFEKNAIVSNCTIVCNRSLTGKGLNHSDTGGHVVNTIVWDNYTTYGDTNGDQDLNNITPAKLAVLDGLCSPHATGDHAVTSDPIFVDPAHGDFRLAANSPCRGAAADGSDLGAFPYDGAASRAVATYEKVSHVYVSTNGTNTAPYDTMDKATDDIQLALRHCQDGTVLTVDDGTYELTKEILLDKGITMKSVSGRETTTFVFAPKTIGRCLRVIHANAKVEGVSFQGGNFESTALHDNGASAVVSYGVVENCRFTDGITSGGGASGTGGVVNNSGTVRSCELIHGQRGANGCGYHQEGAGSLIEDSLITRGYGYHNSESGAGAYLSAGTMDRCQIVGNQCDGSSTGAGCYSALYVSGATVRNTLVAGNYCSNKNGQNAGIQAAASAVIENCTIVSNLTKAAASVASVCGGVYFADKKVTFRNNVVFGNMVGMAGTPEAMETRNLETLTTPASHCAIGAAEVAPEDFKAFWAKDYSLAKGSGLIDKGEKLSWMTSGTLDLAGKNRVSNLIPDIGAYERQIYGMCIILR